MGLKLWRRVWIVGLVCACNGRDPGGTSDAATAVSETASSASSETAGSGASSVTQPETTGESAATTDETATTTGSDDPAVVCAARSTAESCQALEWEYGCTWVSPMTVKRTGDLCGFGDDVESCVALEWCCTGDPECGPPQPDCDYGDWYYQPVAGDLYRVLWVCGGGPPVGWDMCSSCSVDAEEVPVCACFGELAPTP
ncbi:MAG: hypothetical protein KC636_09445 [Myxococcales bacterium]|nr:hypothetical protein [Myxococcales bacterium]